MQDNFKSGFVTLIGRPNVGKSTLMNRLIGQKIAITSNKPQTTRNRIQTVLTTEEGQIVFVDTPGIHKAKNKLGEYMVNIAERSLNEVDVVLWLVEPSTFIGAGEKHIIEQLKKVKTPVILVINKVDMVKKEEVLTFIDAYRKECDFAEIVPVSARRGDNTDELVNVIMKYLPYGPQFYDEDTITDQPERQIVAEIIREKALHSLNAPSMTMSGSLLAESDAPLRTRMVEPEPGAPEPDTTLTPATLPTRASCTVTRLPLLKSSGSMAMTEPVASDFFTLPYPMTTTSDSNWASS